jgi:hypothetical protein
LASPVRSLAGDRRKKKCTQNGKDSLLFEKMIFHSDQPVCDDDSGIFAVMI